MSIPVPTGTDTHHATYVVRAGVSNLDGGYSSYTLNVLSLGMLGIVLPQGIIEWATRGGDVDVLGSIREYGP